MTEIGHYATWAENEKPIVYPAHDERGAAAVWVDKHPRIGENVCISAVNMEHVQTFNTRVNLVKEG